MVTLYKILQTPTPCPIGTTPIGGGYPLGCPPPATNIELVQFTAQPINLEYPILVGLVVGLIFGLLYAGLIVWFSNKN